MMLQWASFKSKECTITSSVILSHWGVEVHKQSNNSFDGTGVSTYWKHSKLTWLAFKTNSLHTYEEQLRNCETQEQLINIHPKMQYIKKLIKKLLSVTCVSITGLSEIT